MVKTYFRYEQEKLFSGSFLNNPEQCALVNCPVKGELLLSAAHETLLITKPGTSAQISRVFPESGQSSANLTCIFPFFMRSELSSFWTKEVSDGEGIDDPMGLFKESEPLHSKNRKTILASSGKKWCMRTKSNSQSIAGGRRVGGRSGLRQR